MFYPSYSWLIPAGALGSFLFGWATGANDVANAFGTSVGAKTLTMLQATVIAAVFEFTGAMVLGRVVTNVIAGGIADVNEFKAEPLLYAYGMMWTSIVGGLWQGFACRVEWNVSATHSIIGGIIGFAFAAKGPNGVLWKTYDAEAFPPYKGIIPIVCSWFFAPVLTAAASAFIFGSVRSLVLRHPDSERRSLYVFPPLVFVTVFINIFFVFTKGAKKMLTATVQNWTDGEAALVSLGVGAGAALLAFLMIPFVRRKVEQKFKREEEEAKARDEAKVEGEGEKPPLEAQSTSYVHKMAEMTKKAVMHGVTVDIHEIVQTDPLVHAIHEDAEKFNPRAEESLAYLQVFSAICVIMAHGAGEVGYMAGPLGTVYHIVTEGKISKKITPPTWIVFLSAASLVLGLATYGYNVTRAMGTRMAKLTPSRGFAAELATALVILMSSQFGLPNSSSQCIVGGIVGVGMMEGKSGVNWSFFFQTFTSWVLTLVVMAVGTGILFAQGVYAPCRSFAH